MERIDLNHLKHEEQTVLALAGVMQAAVMIREYGFTAQYNAEALRTELQSICQLQPEDFTAVYDSIDGLSLGLSHLPLLTQKGNTQEKRYVGRYLMAMIQLAKLLLKDKKLQNQLQHKLHYFLMPLTVDQLIETENLLALGQIYVDIFGGLQFKIQIMGKREILGETSHMMVVRAMLLAGVRAAVLWWQLGGTPWQLLLQRYKIVRTARSLQKHLSEN